MHEAGHAFSACLFAIPFRTVTVAPGPRDSSGGRTLGSIDLDFSVPKWANPWLPEFECGRGRDYIARNVQMTLAGALAETLYTKCWQQGIGLQDEDEALALRVARPLHPTPKATRDWVNRLRFRTLETLRAHWAVVDAIAQELVKRVTLNSAEVHALVRAALPCETEAHARTTGPGTRIPGLHQRAGGENRNRRVRPADRGAGRAPQTIDRRTGSSSSRQDGQGNVRAEGARRAAVCAG